MTRELNEFRQMVVTRSFRELTDTKDRLASCTTPSDLEVVFRHLERWAGKQKRTAQQVKGLNNRGTDADAKLKRIMGALLLFT